MTQLLENKTPQEVKRETLAFASRMKALIVALGKMDFYTFFYFTSAEDFDPKVPVMAMSYRDTISFALPTVVYGPGLVSFIEGILKKDPAIADESIKKIEKRQAISSENKELLKRLFVFKEIVKHEVIHYINLHLPRTVEFFKKKGFQQIPEPLFLLSNAAADSICNIYLDRKVIEKGGLVPPLEKEIQLETLLENLLNRSLMNDGSGNGGSSNSNAGGNVGGNGDDNNTDGNANTSANTNANAGANADNTVESFRNGENGFPDLDYDEAKEISKHDIERLKEVMGGIMEKITEEFKRSNKSIGSVPGEVEEAIKWLKKKRVKFRLVGEDNIFGLFKEVERTFMAYNPLNSNRDGLVFPAYRPLGGHAIAVIVDTSGSMGKEELSYSLDLINGLTKQAETYIVEIDVKIQRIRKIEKIEEEFNFKGRGGTSFTDLERISQFLPARDITACIILTDGYVDEFPEKKPLPKAKWVGITTGIIPKNSPDWIKWFKIEQIVEKED